MRPMRHACFTALLGLAAPLTVLGAVTSVTTAPAVERVAVARPTSVALTWSVTTNTVGAVTITSASGEFRSPAGTVLGVVKQPLSRTAAGPGSVAIPEKFLIPADVVERARRDGHDHLLYHRSFTDGTPAAGEIKLQIATATAAAFGITRLALGFDDGEPLRVVGRGAKLRAEAAVSHTGAGRLRGQWEIAGPNPDEIEPAWRVLVEVTQALTGADAATITSPALPTDQSGFYLVRLRVAEPEAAPDLPVVRYMVRQE